MSRKPDPFYVTTPIYYVNDRPHIGHVYSTTMADVLARLARLEGRPTFFLTGTDEHATKVVDAARDHGLSTQAWADRNAEAFASTFRRLGLSNDDFLRTSEVRHKDLVTRCVRQLLASGDAYLGEYEGWYDSGQEEYVTDKKAEESGLVSPINGKPLIRKREKNYFFRLSKYTDRLLALLDRGEPWQGRTFRILPDARRNEIVNRLREGLSDVPMSRSGMTDWGIDVPGSAEDDRVGRQTVYVWIDALLNYSTGVDSPDRRSFWPPTVQIIAKDILWFHAVIWPALLLALEQSLPGLLYCHSFWISDGQKMSKSLGNFIDLERLDHYVATFGLDALRWFLVTQGPWSTTDSDFSEAKFIDIYNTDLANTLGNCFNRVTNMTSSGFAGLLPLPHDAGSERLARQPTLVAQAVREFSEQTAALRLDRAFATAMGIVRGVDQLIDETQPFKLVKSAETKPLAGGVLHHAAESLRIAAVLLAPVLPDACGKIFDRLGFSAGRSLENRGLGALEDWTHFGGLVPGTPIDKGTPLFQRYPPKS